MTTDTFFGFPTFQWVGMGWMLLLACWFFLAGAVESTRNPVWHEDSVGTRPLWGVLFIAASVATAICLIKVGLEGVSLAVAGIMAVYICLWLLVSRYYWLVKKPKRGMLTGHSPKAILFRLYKKEYTKLDAFVNLVSFLSLLIWGGYTLIAWIGV